MTDKEIALELTRIYINHKNIQIENKHQHTDVEPNFVQALYNSFYKTVSSVDAK